MFNIVYFLLILSYNYWNVVSAVNLIAYISQNGLHGEIYFRQVNTTYVEIKSKLETTLQFPDQSWSWAVHNLPVIYTDIDPIGRCDLSNIGESFIQFDDDLGYLTLPGNETTTWYKEIKLTGENGIWGRSLVLSNGDTRICATITTIEQNLEHMAEARFQTPIAGSVYFRWLAATESDHTDTLIYSNVFHVQKIDSKVTSKSFTEHRWKIYVTDIFEHDHHRSEDNCNFLQLVFDPHGYGEKQGLGDLDERLGKLKVANNALKKQFKAMYRDAKLALLPSDLNIPHRTLYLVLFDYSHPDNFMACAKIRHVKPILYKTFFNLKGIKGEINFSQRSNFDPTFLNFTVASARNDEEGNRQYASDVAGIKIHNLPPNPIRANQENYCTSSGEIFNPRNLENEKLPPPGYGTQDQYPVGDLIGKLQSRNKDYYHNFILSGSSELSGLYWDVFLPLSGVNSIYHRGAVLYRYNRTNPQNISETLWACGTIMHYQKNYLQQKQIFTAQVLFRYPIVGRILFRQPKEEPWYDTVVIVEYLIHADGSTINNTDLHRWGIHDNLPGKDFYDWQNRCNSTGSIVNLNKVFLEERNPEDFCKPWLGQMCRLGDLQNRLGFLNIAGNKKNAEISRKIFIDNNLPLSGRHSILGRSITIYDDNGPKARGERLACSGISGYFRRKTVAKEWYPNGTPLTVKGKLEIVQQSEYDISNVDVELKGLNENSGYHIHMTPVEANLEFPCEASSLYDHWNPRRIDPKKSPFSKLGSTDQYEMGDLSGKFGTLDGLTQYEDSYNDTNLPLFGYESVIGRSIIIHKKDKNLRWACSTLERGYSPSEAREIRAIASFHNPAGYAYGFIKMTQLIHTDGSASDTVIEIKLRHPGKNDRNVTYNHNWQIFVNPVGVDAVVKQTVTRCVAGGYVWNPFYTQLADPLNIALYEQECGPDNPLRCYVGDVSARIGTLDLDGAKRIVVTDPNLPLEGPVSAVGRSIVIFSPEKGTERYACANIEPDHNIVKYVNLQRPPRFVVAQFLDDIRVALGIPEWMLDTDARKTKILHGGSCITMIMHFKGPIAHKLELDFSKLLVTGRLDDPTLFIPGYNNQKRKKTISYRACSVRDPNEKKNKKTFFRSHSTQPKTSYFCFVFVMFILYIN